MTKYFIALICGGFVSLFWAPSSEVTQDYWCPSCESYHEQPADIIQKPNRIIGRKSVQSSNSPELFPPREIRIVGGGDDAAREQALQRAKDQAKEEAKDVWGDPVKPTKEEPQDESEQPIQIPLQKMPDFDGEKHSESVEEWEGLKEDAASKNEDFGESAQNPFDTDEDLENLGVEVYLDYNDRLSRAYEATVRVSVSGGLGSGTIFHEDATNYYVLTNAHVVGGSRTVGCEFTYQHYMSPKFLGEVVAKIGPTSGQDAAIVKVSKANFGFIKMPVIPVKPHKTTMYQLLTCGCQAGEAPSLQECAVDQKTKALVYYTPTSRPGRSGSALTDTDGKSIQGLVAWMTSSGRESRGLAMTTDVLIPWIEQSLNIRIGDSAAGYIPASQMELPDNAVPIPLAPYADLDEPALVSELFTTRSPWFRRLRPSPGQPQRPSPGQPQRPSPGPTDPNSPWGGGDLGGPQQPPAQPPPKDSPGSGDPWGQKDKPPAKPEVPPVKPPTKPETPPSKPPTTPPGSDVPDSLKGKSVEDLISIAALENSRYHKKTHEALEQILMDKTADEETLGRIKRFLEKWRQDDDEYKLANPPAPDLRRGQDDPNTPFINEERLAGRLVKALLTLLGVYKIAWIMPWVIGIAIFLGFDYVVTKFGGPRDWPKYLITYPINKLFSVIGSVLGGIAPAKKAEEVVFTEKAKEKVTSADEVLFDSFLKYKETRSKAAKKAAATRKANAAKKATTTE